MKIIELLNKIANGEELPKKIKYNDKIWRLASNRTYFIGSDYGYDFWVEHSEDKFEDEPITLNDEVEILEEEKKIPLKINKIIPSQNYVISDSKNHSVDERLEIIRKRLYANELYMLDIANTLNEIIDYLKIKGE